MTIGENIRKIRLKKKMTQKELGEKCIPPIAESTIRRYELGKLNPKLETIQKIADALEVSIVALDTRPEFTLMYLEADLKVLNQEELTALNAIPTEEWFGEEWNNTRERFEKKKNAIKDKITTLSKEKDTAIKDSFANGVGARIKFLREENNVTQKQLSHITGIPISLISKYENQIRTPSYEHLYKIAFALKTVVLDISPFFTQETYDKEEDILYNTLITNYNKLNKNGQQKAVEQIELLSKIPEYQEQEPEEDDI